MWEMKVKIRFLFLLSSSLMTMLMHCKWGEVGNSFEPQPLYSTDYEAINRATFTWQDNLSSIELFKTRWSCLFHVSLF